MIIIKILAIIVLGLTCIFLGGVLAMMTFIRDADLWSACYEVRLRKDFGMSPKKLREIVNESKKGE